MNSGAPAPLSKPLERLDPQDADALGLDSDTAAYRTIGSMDDAPDKAKRDAGSLAVSEL